MAYEIKAARYATADHSAVVIETEDYGAVVISERDRPDLWRRLEAWVADGGVVIDHVPVEYDDFDPIDELQALKRLIIEKSIATGAEVEAAVRSVAEQRRKQVSAVANGASR